MSMLRKVGISVVMILYLFAIVPPLMDLLYNKPGLVFGFPIFIVGTTGLSLGMIVVAFIMYFVEDKQERLANNNQAAYGDSRTNGADQ